MAAVLAAAALHATWNALVKAGGDGFAVLALAIGLPALPILALLPFVPLPAAASWPYLVASTLVHWVYFGCLLGAYRHGDLSQVYPIARGTAPLLVALGAWALAGEALGRLEAIGLVVLSAGILSLAWRRGPRPAGEARGMLLALATAATIAAYSLFDGLGVRRAGTVPGYILWVFLMTGGPFLGFALWRRRHDWRVSVAPSLKAGLGGAATSTLAYGIVIWAMSQGPMAHVIALRETSVVIAAGIGAWLLGEPFGRRRLLAAAVAAAGAALLQLG